MRELTIYLIFMTSLGSCYGMDKESPCAPSNIKGQVFVVKKVDQEIKNIETWTALPPEISIHSGSYRNLQFLSGDSLKLSYKDNSGTKVLKKDLSKDFVAKIDFTKWFDEVYTYRGGILTFELIDKKSKSLCTYKMEITGGD